MFGLHVRLVIVTKLSLVGSKVIDIRMTCERDPIFLRRVSKVSWLIGRFECVSRADVYKR